MAGLAQLLPIDSRLCVDSQYAVGAVLSISVVPDGPHGEGKAFARDGARDHVLIVNVQLDVGDGLAVLEALVDLLLKSGDCLGLLGFDGLVNHVGAEVDCDQLAGHAGAVGGGAEDREFEAAGQLLADPGLAQVVAGVKGAENHFLADSSLEVILNGFREGKCFRLNGGNSHGVIGLTGVSIGANASLMQGIVPEM